MILVDFSSSIHRCLHVAVSEMKPRKEDGKFITADFISYWKYIIFEDLFKIQREFSEFGDLVICLDAGSKSYWRREVYPEYKMQRKTIREESEINFNEFFYEVGIFIEYLKKNTPWKVVETDFAEADDIILVLAEEFKNKKILIHSPDKDFFQVHRHSDTIKQYSALHNKYISYDVRSEGMTEWLHEHICLGDSADNVPKIVHETKFSDEFKQFLKNSNKVLSELEYHDLSHNEQLELRKSYGLENEVFKMIRLGPVNLKKKIKEAGSLCEYLKTNPLYERNFRRNYTLVMAEGIPLQIKNQILCDYANASTEFDSKCFEEYLKSIGSGNLISILPLNFRGEIDESFFDW